MNLSLHTTPVGSRVRPMDAKSMSAPLPAWACGRRSNLKEAHSRSRCSSSSIQKRKKSGNCVAQYMYRPRHNGGQNNPHSCHLSAHGQRWGSVRRKGKNHEPCSENQLKRSRTQSGNDKESCLFTTDKPSRSIPEPQFNILGKFRMPPRSHFIQQ